MVSDETFAGRFALNARSAFTMREPDDITKRRRTVATSDSGAALRRLRDIYVSDGLDTWAQIVRTVRRSTLQDRLDAPAHAVAVAEYAVLAADWVGSRLHAADFVALIWVDRLCLTTAVSPAPDPRWRSWMDDEIASIAADEATEGLDELGWVHYEHHEPDPSLYILIPANLTATEAAALVRLAHRRPPSEVSLSGDSMRIHFDDRDDLVSAACTAVSILNDSFARGDSLQDGILVPHSLAAPPTTIAPQSWTTLRRIASGDLELAAATLRRAQTSSHTWFSEARMAVRAAYRDRGAGESASEAWATAEAVTPAIDSGEETGARRTLLDVLTTAELARGARRAIGPDFDPYLYVTCLWPDRLALTHVSTSPDKRSLTELVRIRSALTKLDDGDLAVVVLDIRAGGDWTLPRIEIERRGASLVVRADIPQRDVSVEALDRLVALVHRRPDRAITLDQTTMVLRFTHREHDAAAETLLAAAEAFHPHAGYIASVRVAERPDPTPLAELGRRWDPTSAPWRSNTEGRYLDDWWPDPDRAETDSWLRDGRWLVAM